MHSLASRREEIQKKLEMIRHERERERKVFDELVLQNEDMTPAELCEAARKKALEDEPKSIKVDNTLVSVGDYVQTIDDVQAFFAAERGIFVPDPVKQVYLGEPAKVIRVWPSFQGRPAVELLFADGAAKVFLAECLSLSGGKKGLKKGSSQSPSEKTVHHDPERLSFLESALSVDPEPLPQASWRTIGKIGDIRNTNERGKENKIVCSSLKSSVETGGNGKVLIKTGGQERQGSHIGTAENSYSGYTSTLGESYCNEGYVDKEQSIGLVKEVLSGRRHCVSVEERLGSPLNFESISALPVASGGENDNLLMTPRVELLSCRRQKEDSYALAVSKKENSIPKKCPPEYKARFFLDDSETKIPRYSAATRSSDAECRCVVAGVQPGKAEMTLRSVSFLKEGSSLEEVLSTVTRELDWHLEKGKEAKRLFTKEGVEITNVNAICGGMLIVATQGHTYRADSAVSPPVSTEPAAVVVAEATQPQPQRSATAAAAAAAASVTKEKKTLSSTVVVSSLGKVKKSQSLNSTTTASSVNSKSVSQQKLLAGKKFSSNILPPSSNKVAKGKVQRPAARAAGKGITKLISLRVFSNGEYGDNCFDRFPFRVVTLRPIHKTMKAVANTIERELGWNSMGKKIDKIFNPLGVEIKLLDEFVDGQAVVVSAGDSFVFPHPSTLLYKDVVKIRENVNVLPGSESNYTLSAENGFKR